MRRQDRSTRRQRAGWVRTSLSAGCACLGLLVGLAAPALAERDPDDTGVYVSGGLLISVPTLQDVGSVDFNAAVGGDAAVGYRVLSPLAVQLRGAWLGTGFGAEDPDAAGTNVNAATITLDTKLFLMTDKLQPFALFGFGGMWGKFDVPAVSPEESKEWSSVVRFGGGVDYWIDTNTFISCGAYYALPQQKNSDIRYVEIEILTVGYRF